MQLVTCHYRVKVDGVGGHSRSTIFEDTPLKAGDCLYKNSVAHLKPSRRT